jgi:ferric-dicitrate binding protein FerR (iron transport regulator)
MSDERRTLTDESGEARDPIEALVRSAGLGVNPDPARMERAMRNVHGEWRAALAERRRARWRALAAGLAVVSAIATLVFALRPAQPVPVATITRVIGDGVIRHAADGKVEVEALRAGRVLLSGEEIDTGHTGRVLLSAASGAQLRIDTASISQWRSASELRLTSGTVYVETSSSSGVQRLTVSTPLGDVRHVGTRFEVHVTNGETRVRVRDGRVSFASPGRAPVLLGAGQQLVAGPGTALMQAGPGSAAPEWQWTRAIGPAFTIEGRSALEALDWLSHETGLRVVYASETARAQARATILRGTIDGLDTQAALLAVLSGSDLRFELHADRVEVRSSDSR